MDTLLYDLRYAARRTRKAPGFSLIVVLTLALGIGANTAIFSVVDALILRPLPYRDPGRLVTIEHHYPSLNDLKAPVSASGFRHYRDDTRSFESVAVSTGWQPNLTGAGEPERLLGAQGSARFFEVLGIAPALGRTWTAAEDEPGNNQVVVLSDGLWRRRFGADAGIVGRTIRLDGAPYTVIGVMPRGFHGFFNRRAELWRPVALTPKQYAAGATNEFLSLSARLKPGVSVAQARREMAAFAERLKRDNPGTYPPKWGLLVTTLDEKAKGDVRGALLVLLGAVGFVLLIACANVANLLLARASGRAREIAVRTAMGASRRALIRQLMTESLLLSLAGAGLGLLLASWGLHAITALGPAAVAGMDIHVSGRVLGFTLLVAVATGLLFGLAPALQTSRTDVQETLREGQRGSSERAGRRLRRALVVGEVALALTLLAGAGLLVRSFARIQGVDPGFDPHHLLTFSIALPKAGYPLDTAQIAFWDRTLERLRSTPGVVAVGMTSNLPFSGGWSTGSFTVEGYTPPPGQPGPWGDIRVASTGFARAMRLPLIRGRFIGTQDRAGAAPVVVVDQEMARRYWPGDDPVGKRITFDSPSDSAHWITVVGVVAHAAQEGLTAEHRVQLYFPPAEAAAAFGGLPFETFAVRTAGDPLRMTATVRRAIEDIDPAQPISDVNTMDAMIAESLGQRRLTTVLLGLFAGLALGLAGLGIYGIMSHMVTQRSRELGIRIALGAAPGRVLGLVLREGAAITLVGLAIGLAGAFGLTRLIASQLFAVPATDPVTFVAVSATLAAAALLATLVPALRAMRVDPVEALRQE